MEIKQLRTLQAVIEQGSFQKAGDFLGYTQSTVSTQVQQLEEELGVPLFQKIGRKMELTDVGKQVLQDSHEILYGIDRLKEHARAGLELTGTLRVSMAESLLCYQMQEVLYKFKQIAPQVHLVIENGTPNSIEKDILSGTCDIGVSYYDYPKHQDILDLTYLQSEAELVLVASPEFEHTDFTTPHQLKPVSLIMDEPENVFRLHLENYLREKDITLGETMELWSTEAIKRCVTANLGFSYLPYFTVKNELASGQLIRLDAPVSGTTFPIIMSHRKNRWISPPMKLFSELLEEQFKI